MPSGPARAFFVWLNELLAEQAVGMAVVLGLEDLYD